MDEQNIKNLLTMMITTSIMSPSDKSNETKYDKIINMALMIIAGLIIAKLSSIVSLMKSWIGMCFKKQNDGKTFVTYKIRAKISYNNGIPSQNVVSKQFFAVTEFINELSKERNMKISFEDYDLSIYGANALRFIEFDANDHATTNNGLEIKITDTLSIIPKKDESFGDKDKTNSTCCFQYLIKSYKPSIGEINDFIANCVARYEEKRMAKITPMIFTYLGTESDKVITPIYKTISFDTTKSFDNLFFSGKDKLIEKLDNFTNGEKRYRELGIPYTFGLLLHGDPGTGKTSCIKAIAKHTKRYPVIIPTNNVKDIECLKEIFRNEVMAGYRIPNKERLYIFEEIDCGSWKDVVTSRKIKHDEENHSSLILNDKQKLISLDELDKFITAERLISRSVSHEGFHAKTDKITLGDILELLDGLVEMTGRMFIMTSNHPERLDPALLRPGRIDETIWFKNMTCNDIRNMYKLWFKQPLPALVDSQIKDHMISQAEVGKIFSSSKDMNKIHTELINLCS